MIVLFVVVWLVLGALWARRHYVVLRENERLRALVAALEERLETHAALSVPESPDDVRLPPGRTL